LKKGVPFCSVREGGMDVPSVVGATEECVVVMKAKEEGKSDM
jgi:hypothetical protein